MGDIYGIFHLLKPETVLAIKRNCKEKGVGGKRVFSKPSIAVQTGLGRGGKNWGQKKASKKV